MLSTLAKAATLTGALLLITACSGLSTTSCFSADCQSLDGRPSSNATKVNFGGSAIGNNFSQYSEGLLHD